MNRKTIIFSAAVVAVLAAGYPASSWYFGSQIETKLRRLVDDQVAAVPYIKLVRYDYERGVFSANETAVIEMPSLPGVRVTLKSVIQHGPVLGSGAFGMGSSMTAIEFGDEAIQKKVQEAFGGNPLELRTLFDFGGGGRATLTSPKFSLSLPAKKEEITFSSDGFEATLDFTRHMDRYTVRGTAPRFEFQGNDARIKFTGLKFDSELQRMLPDVALYTGTQRFSLAAMEGEAKADQPKFAMKDMKCEMSSVPDGEFIDLIARLGAANFVIGEQDFGPVAYDFSMKHLRARTLATLNRKFNEAYGSLQDPEQVLLALEPMREEIISLLLDGFVTSIDRVAFHLPDGEAQLSMSIKLTDARAEDFDAPLVLVGKIDASADLALPSSLFKILRQADSEMEDEDDEEEEAQGVFDEMVAKLIRQGYVTNDNGILKSRLVFKAGKLLINDKPFDLMRLLGGHG